MSELLHIFPERTPAIPSIELRLPNGDYANKCSLLRSAWKAGLPVPPILTEAEAIAQFSQEEGDDHHAIMCRGFMPAPVDMHAVDTLPTLPFYGPLSLNDAIKAIISIDDHTRQYLLTNFDVIDPDPHYFLQRRFEIPEGGKPVDISVFTYGTQRVINYMMLGNRHFIESRTFDIKTGERLSWGDAGVIYEERKLINKVNSLVAQVEAVYNQQFKQPFHYKHDLMLNYLSRELVLIQSRVATPVLTNEVYSQQVEQIAHHLQSNFPVITFDMRRLSNLPNCPNKPFVGFVTKGTLGFSMTQNTIRSLDLSSMMGLIIPDHFNGGLLEHNGYNIIAYAFYWGLPVAFYSDVKKIYGTKI